MSRMFERIGRDELAIGTIMLAPSRELVEVAGYGGLDFVCLDMMVTPLDWDRAAQMVLAANRFGVTPWLRLPAYPWDDTGLDPGLPAQVLRGLSIGAECVLASVSTPRQVEQLLHPLSNPHRRLYVLHGGGHRTEEQRRFDEAQSEQWVVPIIESQAALDNLDGILAVEGLRMVYIGMGDLTKALGRAGDDRHPEVQATVAAITSRARERGVRVAANTLGYRDDAELADQVVAGVGELAKLGINPIMTPRPTMVVQRYYESMLRRVRSS